MRSFAHDLQHSLLKRARRGESGNEEGEGAKGRWRRGVRKGEDGATGGEG